MVRPDQHKDWRPRQWPELPDTLTEASKRGEHEQRQEIERIEATLDQELLTADLPHVVPVSCEQVAACLQHRWSAVGWKVRYSAGREGTRYVNWRLEFVGWR